MKAGGCLPDALEQVQLSKRAAYPPGLHGIAQLLSDGAEPIAGRHVFGQGSAAGD